MKKKISLKDPETGEVIAQVNLLEIDWYNDLIPAWETFLEEFGDDIDEFIIYLNETTNLKIEKCKN